MSGRRNHSHSTGSSGCRSEDSLQSAMAISTNCRCCLRHEVLRATAPEWCSTARNNSLCYATGRMDDQRARSRLIQLRPPVRGTCVNYFKMGHSLIANGTGRCGGRRCGCWLLCTVVSRRRKFAVRRCSLLRCGGEIPPLEVQRDAYQSNHHGHLDQRPNHSRKRLSRIDSKDGNGHRNR